MPTNNMSDADFDEVDAWFEAQEAEYEAQATEWESQRKKKRATAGLTLEQLTKAKGKHKYVNPETGEFEKDPVTGETEVPTLTLSPDKASLAVFGVLLLRLSANDTSDKPKLWTHNDVIWEPIGEKKVKDIIDAVIGDLSYERGLQETLRRLRGLSERAYWNKNPFLFPCQDGVIDLETGKIRPHSFDDYITYTYNAKCNYLRADYDRFLFYLASTFPDIRDCLTAIDIITKVGIRVTFETFVFLLGGGENGKGILEKIIIAMYTISRGSAIKIEELKRSHFAMGNMIDNDYLIITEVETINDVMSIIKALASGELQDSDVKYSTDRIKVMPHILPIIDSNKALHFTDKSRGRKRRTQKLDFPYTFGYTSDTRPKDPKLLDKLTTPESLAGILKIIRGRAPSLIESRRIYQRKSSEQMEAELERQKFSFEHFTDECLSTEWTENGDAPRLKVDDAYKVYLDYCKLFNVPEPASNSPFGRDINKKYNLETKSTSERIDGKKVSYRYYPGLYLVKLPEKAFKEFCDSYTTDIIGNTTDKPLNTTDILRMWIGENNNSKENTTDTTDKVVLKEVLEKLAKMYKYVHSKTNSEITFENFEKAVYA